jgi:uncharacterized membrane protein
LILTSFLLTRGLWLVLLELTVICLGWDFNLDFSVVFFQVIWAIGWSMVVLSVLLFLPRGVIAAVAVGMIAFHNLFDGVEASSLGNLGWLWQVLHVQSKIEYATGHEFFVIYPLIPWIGVMAAGYLFGGVLQKEERFRHRASYGIGFGLIGVFILLRPINVYGDPHPWSVQDTPVKTALSFIDTHKYPPSLLYLMMTLGPAVKEAWLSYLQSGHLSVTGERPGGCRYVAAQVRKFFAPMV